ncbi:hypothetical protein Rsub_10383 [Raphidocelis subcapitata]|uniref:Uncharacterized protein n=1 Tax=Raphidocelis subcapitata TaxID=307507 RepID=A0A2V0PHT0_9CHLO|nr:hypothetical protein Rsub_10383 [Raphidocelis subcapitata]|eukprot:GBF97460.1 hypothetical protein Rsub_10383 [Raphidocelis subcapitata]
MQQGRRRCAVWAAAVPLLLLLQLFAGADAARQLRQTTDALTSSTGIDRSRLSVAITLNAQAVTEAKSAGVQHNEASVASIAADRMPAAMSKTATSGGLFQMGGFGEAGIAAFGPVAVAATDQGFLAASAPNSMLLATDKGTPGTARGNTLPVFEPQNAPGVGKSKMVQTASVGHNHLPANSFSMSEMGDGPHAIAQAGDAVSGSYSSKDVGTDGAAGGASTRGREAAEAAQGPWYAKPEVYGGDVPLEFLPAAAGRALAAGRRAGAGSDAAGGAQQRRLRSAAGAAGTASGAAAGDPRPWGAVGAPGGGIYGGVVAAQALGAANSDLYAAATINAPSALVDSYHVAEAERSAVAAANAHAEGAGEGAGMGVAPRAASSRTVPAAGERPTMGSAFFGR